MSDYARYRSPWGRWVKRADSLTSIDGDSVQILAWSPKEVHRAALAALYNITTTDPLITDDSDSGYSVGSRWINTATDEEFVCVDNTVGAAVWLSTTAGTGGGGGVDSYFETVTVWTLSAGDIYYADIVHSLGTKDVFVTMRDSTTEEWVGVHDIDATDDNTIRVYIKGNTATIRVGVLSGVGVVTSAVTTLSSWTVDVAPIYYEDFVHNLGTNDTRQSFYDNATLEDVGVHRVDRTDTNTLRVYVKGNSLSLRLMVNKL